MSYWVTAIYLTCVPQSSCPTYSRPLKPSVYQFRHIPVLLVFPSRQLVFRLEPITTNTFYNFLSYVFPYIVSSNQYSNPCTSISLYLWFVEKNGLEPLTFFPFTVWALPAELLPHCNWLTHSAARFSFPTRQQFRPPMLYTKLSNQLQCKCIWKLFHVQKKFLKFCQSRVSPKTLPPRIENSPAAPLIQIQKKESLSYSINPNKIDSI